MTRAITVANAPAIASLPASAAPRTAAIKTEAFELIGFSALLAPEWFCLVA